jgi:hypothetical protein
MATVQVDTPSALPTARVVEPTSTEERSVPSAAPTQRVESPTPTEIVPTETILPHVSVHAVKGNTFIRRGPDMAFNFVDVLYKDEVATAIARDVLSAWVQIKIPHSDKTGWLYIDNHFLQVEGNVKDLPELSPTEWPVAAYVRNCTYHQMYVMPGDTLIPSLRQKPDNEVWIYPGTYKVFDIDISGDPQVADFSIREGTSIDITEDGTGDRHKCPP